MQDETHWKYSLLDTTVKTNSQFVNNNIEKLHDFKRYMYKVIQVCIYCEHYLCSVSYRFVYPIGLCIL